MGGMSTVPSAGNVEIFKARTNKWFAWLAWTVALVGLVVTVAAAGPAALAGTAPLLLIALLGWQFFWMPAVVVDDGGVTLENPFRTVLVPWAALVHVDTRYALTLVTAEKSYAAWAAPAPGIWGGRNARPEDLAGLPDTSYGPGKSVRPGDLKSTDSGQAARLVRSRWRDQVESGAVAAADTDSDAIAVTVTPRWAAIGVVVVLLAASYWAVAAQ